jgi:hypothetical protein
MKYEKFYKRSLVKYYKLFKSFSSVIIRVGFNLRISQAILWILIKDQWSAISNIAIIYWNENHIIYMLYYKLVWCYNSNNDI